MPWKILVLLLYLLFTYYFISFFWPLEGSSTFHWSDYRKRAWQCFLPATLYKTLPWPFIVQGQEIHTIPVHSSFPVISKTFIPNEYHTLFLCWILLILHTFSILYFTLAVPVLFHFYYYILYFIFYTRGWFRNLI